MIFQLFPPKPLKVQTVVKIWNGQAAVIVCNRFLCDTEILSLWPNSGLGEGEYGFIFNYLNSKVMVQQFVKLYQISNAVLTAEEFGGYFLHFRNMGKYQHKP